MIDFFKLTKKDFKLLLVSVLIALFVFSGFYAKKASGEAVTLTATVQTKMTFTTSTDVFGNLTPGTPKFATTTLDVETNTTNGWYIELYGDDQGDADTVMDLNTDASVGITDDTEWIPGTATTSAGNATAITEGDDYLAFRVMTASGSTPFLADGWWGTSDVAYNAANYWTGIASSTAANLKIGEIISGDYQSSKLLNTVQYYLDVSSSQQTGDYSGGLIYTAVTP